MRARRTRAPVVVPERRAAPGLRGRYGGAGLRRDRAGQRPHLRFQGRRLCAPQPAFHGRRRPNRVRRRRPRSSGNPCSRDRTGGSPPLRALRTAPGRLPRRLPDVLSDERWLPTLLGKLEGRADLRDRVGGMPAAAEWLRAIAGARAWKANDIRRLVRLEPLFEDDPEAFMAAIVSGVRALEGSEPASAVFAALSLLHLARRRRAVRSELADAEREEAFVLALRDLPSGEMIVRLHAQLADLPMDIPGARAVWRHLGNAEKGLWQWRIRAGRRRRPSPAARLGRVPSRLDVAGRLPRRRAPGRRSLAARAGTGRPPHAGPIVRPAHLAARGLPRPRDDLRPAGLNGLTNRAQTGRPDFPPRRGGARHDAWTERTRPVRPRTPGWRSHR